MAQIFPENSNTLARLSILFVILFAGGAISLVLAVERSTWKTNEGMVYEQPVPFSHDHHTAGLGIDCRYCHTSVEVAASASIPPTETCMNCHKLIWVESPLLEPVRASWRNDEPIRWNRVHDLPDYVYFNHSVHVAAGVGCVSCHGKVNEMPLIAKGASLQMSWCLDCHRAPEKNLRPPEEVFNMDWERPTDDPEYGAKLAEAYPFLGDEYRLTSCSTCHR
ncbi:MAG: cytochrome c3 family protein [Acidobacteriota bacterium]